MTTRTRLFGLGPELAQVRQERRADVAVRRLLHVEREARAVATPRVAHSRRVVRVGREEDGTRVRDVERPRAVDGAHRGRVDVRDEDAHDEMLRQPVARDGRHVRDDDARLGE
jgi:hypothetical protein